MGYVIYTKFMTTVVIYCLTTAGMENPQIPRSLICSLILQMPWKMSGISKHSNICSTNKLIN